MRRSRAAAVFLIVLLAGCTGAKTAVPGPEATLVMVRPDLWISSDTGAIAGQVLNDASLPVRGARLSLLGTDFFQDADDAGRFLFTNLTPGVQRLQAFAPGYVTNETDTLVTAANLTTLTLYLLPDASRGAGYTPHLHDFWGGADTYLLMDNDHDFRQEGRPVEASKANTNNTPTSAQDSMRIKLPASSAGHPIIILPGTKEIQFRLTWSSSASTLTRMGIRYSPPGTSPLTPQATSVRAAGQVLSIPVTPELADSGHQLFTYWMFFLCPCNDPRNAPNYEPGAILGPIHIQITLVRGNVELEPGHPDFWKGADHLVLLPGEWKAHSYLNGNERTSTNCLTLTKPTLVPPGTTHARFELRWRYNTANNTALDRNYVLTWRTADQDPTMTRFSEHRRSSGARGDHHILYDIEVPAAQADSFYQQRSNWCWLPSAEGEENSETATDLGRGLQVWLRVEASRTSTA